MADRYRLEPVRDARSRAERVKRGDLAAAVGEARATEHAVEAAGARVAAARTALDDARRVLATPAGAAHAVALAERFVERRRKELATAIAEQLRAQAAHAGRLEQIDAARAELVRARADREVIERHFERWRETQRKLAERRDD